MRCVFALAPLFVLAWLPAAAQQNALAVGPSGTGLASPVLLPPTLVVSTAKHCDELDGVVKFSATIDTAGLPRELKTLEASDRRLIGFATELVAAQRFKPGVMDGSPTAVAIELTVGLHTCAQREKSPTYDNFYTFRLRAHPLIALAVVSPKAAQGVASAAPAKAAPSEEVGGHIGAPIPMVLTDPQIPISGKMSKRGFCLLGVTIDANGVPQNIRVVRSLDPELDSNAVEAVKHWRFKPALRDGGAPVAVEGTFSATFEYVDKEPVAFAFFIPETPEKVQAWMTHGKTKRPDMEPVNADEVVAVYMPQSRVPGRCIVSLVIDTNGVPQNVHVIKSLDSSVDMETAAMVQHLRFKPATMDGTAPVPVGLIVPVRYRGMVERPTWRDLFVSALALAFFL